MMMRNFAFQTLLNLLISIPDLFLSSYGI